MTHWEADAACRYADPDLPFGDSNDEDERFDTADAKQFVEDYCAQCPVLLECRAAGKDASFGVWGGIMRAREKRG